MTVNDPHNKPFPIRRADVLACMFLVIATLAVYWQVTNHAFVNYDDDTYVTDNRMVQSGLTKKSILWSFRTTEAANWHPLTWLSHMTDCQLYGMNSGLHHSTSILFHIVNAILLFFVLNRMTGKLWPSSFVAALFALHPLHVESVAWVAERKDVLSTFFWMLTIWCYIRYVEHPRPNRYLLLLLCLTLGLMAKPMLVTLPFVLLLLDYWPLGRFKFHAPRLILEKIPLFVLVAASSVVTFFVQQRGGAVGSLVILPLHIRIADALVSYIGYIAKTIWPYDLAVFYPYPKIFPGWEVVGAAILLVSISFLVIKTGRRRPYLAVGWLWYLGTLVPVIGLVQVGLQSMADRYTYVPIIGIFIIIAWGIPELVARWRHKDTGIATIGAVLLSILMAITWLQVRYWSSSITLFEHAVEATSGNYVAHDNLGIALFNQGRVDEAMGHYTQALRIKPDFEKAHNNLGAAFFQKGKIDKAIEHYTQALRIKPDFGKAHNNLGAALFQKGKIDEAIEHYTAALRLDPDSVAAHVNLGDALVSRGKVAEAIKHYADALRIRPDNEMAQYKLGNALARQGKLEQAIKHYLETLRIRPDLAKAHNNLGVALARQGRYREAINHFSEALRIRPGFKGAHKNLERAKRLMARSGHR